MPPPSSQFVIRRAIGARLHVQSIDRPLVPSLMSLSFANVAASNAGAARNVAPPRATVTSPPEEVSAEFSLEQVVTLNIPFGTAHAAGIRNVVSSRLLNEKNARVFVFRSQPVSWSNIALDSTATAPKITCPPAEIASKLMTILGACASVSKVVLFGPGKVVMTPDEIAQLPFHSLEELAVPASAVVVPNHLPADANCFVREIKDLEDKFEKHFCMVKTDLVQLKTSMEEKLSYIIDLLEGQPRQNDQASRAQLRDPALVVYRDDSGTPVFYSRTEEAGSSSPENATQVVGKRAGSSHSATEVRSKRSGKQTRQFDAEPK